MSESGDEAAIALAEVFREARVDFLKRDDLETRLAKRLGYVRTEAVLKRLVRGELDPYGRFEGRNPQQVLFGRRDAVPPKGYHLAFLDEAKAHNSLRSPMPVPPRALGFWERREYRRQLKRAPILAKADFSRDLVRAVGEQDEIVEVDGIKRTKGFVFPDTLLKRLDEREREVYRRFGLEPAPPREERRSK